MSEFPRQTESVRDDPWKVLIAVRLLNVTTGTAAIPVFCKIISRWPTPQDLVRGGSCHRVCLIYQADVKDPVPQDELVQLLRPLGLYNKRARWLKTCPSASSRIEKPRVALWGLYCPMNAACLLHLSCATSAQAHTHATRSASFVRVTRTRGKTSCRETRNWCATWYALVSDIGRAD
jgi:hypothetical protein